MKKIALVTGGTRGLGLSIATHLSKNGYRVYVVSRSESTLPRGIFSLRADISTLKGCLFVKKEMLKREKNFDLLINNAGVSIGEDINIFFNLNVFAAYRLIKLFENKLSMSSGRVINITSLNGLVPTPNAELYSSTKHALEGLGIAWSYKLKKRRIFLTNIATGAICNPDAAKQQHPTLRDKSVIINKLFPLLTPDRVADKIVKLLGEPNPPKRVIIGRDAKLSYYLYSYLPGFWHFLMERMYR